MYTKQKHFVSDLVVVRHHHAAVAESAKILAGEKGDTAHIADGAGPLPPIFRTDRLRHVLHNPNAVLLRYAQERLHVATLTVDMDGNNRLGSAGDLRFDIRGFEVVRVRLDVHENRPGAQPGDGTRGSEEGVGRRDNFVPRPNPQRHQSQQKRIAARSTPNRVLRCAVAGHCGLQTFHRRPKDEILRLHYGPHSLLDLPPNRGVLPFQIQQRDFHGFSLQSPDDHELVVSNAQERDT